MMARKQYKKPSRRLLLTDNKDDSLQDFCTPKIFFAHLKMMGRCECESWGGERYFQSPKVKPWGFFVPFNC